MITVYHDITVLSIDVSYNVIVVYLCIIYIDIMVHLCYNGIVEKHTFISRFKTMEQEVSHGGGRETSHDRCKEKSEC